MCGGKGTRLKAGEKPLFKVCGKALIDHAISQLSGFDVIAITSTNTPKTEEYLKKLGVRVYRSAGKGFIEDYIEACKVLQILEPVLVLSSDIVYFREGIVREVIEYYKKCKKDALKVLVGEEPVGINIVNAALIDYEQEEDIFRLSEYDVMNVNTLQDAKKAEDIWMYMRKKEKNSQKI